MPVLIYTTLPVDCYTTNFHPLWGDSTHVTHVMVGYHMITFIGESCGYNLCDDELESSLTVVL